MTAAAPNTHPGRAALAQALCALETTARYGSGEPRRSRAEAIRIANAACQEAQLPVMTNQAVSDWFRHGRAAEDFESLWRLITVLLAWSGRKAAQPDHDVWRRYWELARTTETRPTAPADPATPAPKTRPRLGRPVADVDPVRDLEVHPALESSGTTTVAALPEYVPRQHDQWLSDAREAAQHSSRMAVLVADSSTGKTRALWECVRRLRAPWRVWRPADRTALLAGLEQRHSLAHTVLWLNELQRYLLPHNQPDPDGQAAASLTTLLADPGRGPVLVLGTLWHKHHDTLTHEPDDPAGPDPHQLARALLNGRTRTVPDSFGPEAIAAMEGLAVRDARLAEALRCGGQRITQYLAGARELVRLYDDAPPEARAVLEAAADARRLGVGEDLPRTFLQEAAAAYLDPGHWAAQTDPWRASWFTRALDYTGRPCRGIPGPLAPKVSPPGRPVTNEVYHLADYLQEHTGRVRWRTPLPAGFWSAAAEHLTRAGDLTALAYAAERRVRLRIAYGLYEAAVRAGNADAWWKLIWQQALNGNLAAAESLARTAADAGHFDGLNGLVRLLNQEDDQAEAERLLWAAVESGDTSALASIGRRRFEEGQWDEAERLVRQSGDARALLGLAESMAEDGARAERLCRAAAEAGDPEGLRMVSRFREDAGDAEGAEQAALEAAEAGQGSAAWELAVRRDGAGDREAARRFALRAARSGHGDAAAQLAWAGQQTGDVEGAICLYQAAVDAGDLESLAPLARLREQAGDPDEAARLYEAAVNAGQVEALGWLARLRDRAGDREDVERIYRTALEAGNPGGLRSLWTVWDQTEGHERAEEFALRAAQNGHTEVLYELACWRNITGNREAAFRLHQAAADAGDSRSLAPLADLREKAGDRAQAERLALRAAEAGHPDVLLRLAHDREEAGSPDEAERLCRTAAGLGHTEALTCLVQLQERTGRQREAEENALRRADAGDTEALWQLLQLRKRAQDEEGARRLYRIFTLDAGMARPSYAIPWIYDEEGAARVRRYGLEADGTPTTPDQWQDTGTCP